MREKISHVTFTFAHFEKSPFRYHAEVAPSDVRLEVWHEDWSLQWILFEGPNHGLEMLQIMVESFHDTLKTCANKRTSYEALDAKMRLYAITYGGVMP